MTVVEARQLMAKYLLPSIAPFGYEEKKGKSPDFEFSKKTSTGEDVIIGGFTDYNPVQRIIYSLSKRNKAVNNILLKLQAEGIRLTPKITKTTDTIGLSYSTLNGLNQSSYLPDVAREEDMIKNVSLMTVFLVDTAFPLMDRLEDVKEIDKIINGPEPWTTDWQMPYVFAGQFYEKRLIIAKLAGNPAFEELVDFNYKTLERLSAENGSPFTYDRSNFSKPLPALIRILEQVNPL